MKKKLWIYRDLNEDLSNLYSVFKRFREIELINSLDKLNNINGDIIIVLNIRINSQIAQILENLDFSTRLFASKFLDSVSLKNMDSLFDDVYIGDTRDALIKYLSNSLRGFYD